MNHSSILDKQQIQALIDQNLLMGWEKKSYLDFRRVMLDNSAPYPCYFAVEAEKKGWARYLFADSANDEKELKRVKVGLEEYLQNYRSISKRTTMIIFFKPLPKNTPAEEYKKQFWNVLKYLHENDSHPWPEDIPADPNHPKWEFCFAGEPMFIVARAPYFNARRSRYNENGLEITIQPRGTLEDITGETPQGKQVRKIIRQRLEKYDFISPHPDIGDYGDPNNLEWKQYILPDTNDESVVRCPITGRRAVR
jgi:uncharacterized protein